jgi:phosphoglycerate dehydrogenase-like enzyme
VTTLPPAGDLTVLFAHPAYQVAEEFRRRRPTMRTLKAVNAAELTALAPEADVIVVSGLWRNELLAAVPKLRFVQSISAGTDQYDKDAFRARAVRLASAQGANERAVAEHALALLLALKRHIHFGRDAQAERRWRPMIADPLTREQEIGGLHAVVVGFGRIGQRVGRLLKAFDVRVTGLRREAAPVPEAADEVRPIAALDDVLPMADVVILTCPLTPETVGLIGADALQRMKPSAILINVARGKVVDEPALIAALQAGRIAAAGLDVTVEEPLPASSPLWAMPQVLITPHSAGETGRYEANVIDLLEENLSRLWRGEERLLNEVV